MNAVRPIRRVLVALITLTLINTKGIRKLMANLADLNLVVDKLTEAVNTAFADIAAEVKNLQAQIATGADTQPTIDKINAILATVTSNDPGAPKA